MFETAAITIIAVLTLGINYTNLLLVFPRRLNILLSISLPILFTVIFHTILLAAGEMGTIFGGFRGFVHLPLLLLLLKGPFFHKMFGIIFQMLLAGFQLVTARFLAKIFAVPESEQYYMLYFIFSFIFFTFYVIIVSKHGRQFMIKLFSSGSRKEWALYSFGALFSFTIFAVTYETVTTTWLYILLMIFTLWSFCILCYAIINTHEKTRQKYDAEFARSIISSGRDHYQKMNEMYEKLRILRHDYKFHLNAAREMLRSGDTEDAQQYMTGMESQLTGYDLPSFCANSVINALIASYAEQCTKHAIEFNVNLPMPDSLQIPIYDICIILGNLLENAVEACKKTQQNPMINLAAQNTDTQFLLMVKNSYNGKIHHYDGKPISTKTNGGIGLQSIQAVAARYGGELFTEWEKGIFTAYVTVKLNSS